MIYIIYIYIYSWNIFLPRHINNIMKIYLVSSVGVGKISGVRQGSCRRRVVLVLKLLWIAAKSNTTFASCNCAATTTTRRWLQRCAYCSCCWQISIVDRVLATLLLQKFSLDCVLVYLR